jgi:hypothetical protein
MKRLQNVPLPDSILQLRKEEDRFEKRNAIHGDDFGTGSSSFADRCFVGETELKQKMKTEKNEIVTYRI